MTEKEIIEKLSEVFIKDYLEDTSERISYIKDKINEVKETEI